MHDGRLTLGPFPFEDRPFPSGEFTIYIYSLPNKHQPESVMEIIGENGINLTGQNVIAGMVVFGKEFMITGTKG